ncbi:hypothetical protein HPB50_001386 [Hyalomma asiaticum]|uniref:Uncharacterized protein n=1 Tax=Hyalomma asiaticum TaxID=266040 RepID=A0ACB7S9R6_HYAAI|nr:hypothetical protein HPB50_001386 [Hyalomma asiaticum]
MVGRSNLARSYITNAYDRNRVLSRAQVNGVNVEDTSYKDILDRISSTPTETRLLVADEATFQWYKKHGGSDSQPSVLELSSAETPGHSASKQAGLSPASSTPAVVSRSAEHDDGHKSGEHTSADPSMGNVPVSKTGTSEPSPNQKQEPRNLHEPVEHASTDRSTGHQAADMSSTNEVSASAKKEPQTPQKLVEHAIPDMSTENQAVNKSDIGRTFVNVKQEPGSPQKSVEHPSQPSEVGNQPVDKSGTVGLLKNVKQEPSSPKDSVVRRRTTTEETSPPSFRGTGLQVISPPAPAPPTAVSARRHEESSKQAPVRLPPLDIVEVTVRLLLAMRLPLPLLIGAMITSLLAVYYMWAYYSKPSQN